MTIKEIFKKLVLVIITFLIILTLLSSIVLMNNCSRLIEVFINDPQTIIHQPKQKHRVFNEEIVMKEETRKSLEKLDKSIVGSIAILVNDSLTLLSPSKLQGLLVLEIIAESSTRKSVLDIVSKGESASSQEELYSLTDDIREYVRSLSDKALAEYVRKANEVVEVMVRRKKSGSSLN
jgi:hypothetical protein